MPYKEKGGTWRAKVKRDGQVYARRCETRKEALDWEAAKRKELSAIRNQTLTVSLREAATKYLNLCEKQYIRSTYTNKRKALKELADVTGNIGIEQIEPDAIMNEVILKQTTPSLSNIRRKDLHVFFEYCRKFHGLRFNPVTPIEKIPQERRPQPTPTNAEYNKLLLKCSDRQDRNMIIAFANSGARRAELFRMTFSEDVDFKERIIRLGNRKNRSRTMRYRYIPMNDLLYDALKDQFKHRLPDSDYVFQNRAVYKDRDGKIVNKHPNYGGKFTTRRRFMPGLCKEAKVKEMGFHALRRYFASKLIENGEDLETVRYLMGHSSASTTDRYIYTLTNDMKRFRAAVTRLKTERAHEGAHDKEKGVSKNS